VPTAVARSRPLAALVVALALLCVGAPNALAVGSLGGSSLSQEAEQELPKSSSESESANKETKEAETSNSNSTLLIGIIVAVVLLAGIGMVIVRDARRRAPVTDAELDAAVARSSHDNAEHLRRRRAKAKAAKKQRKRNR